MKAKLLAGAFLLFFIGAVLAAALKLHLKADPDAPLLPIIEKAADFEAKDVNGKTVRLSDFRGKVIFLTFFYATCTDACPMIGSRFWELQDKLKRAKLFGTKVFLLSLTFDPQRDTPEKLRATSKDWLADPKGWLFLHAPPHKVRRTLDAYDIWVKKLKNGVLDHSVRVFLIDKRGRIRNIYDWAFLEPPYALEDAQTLLSEP